MKQQIINHFQGNYREFYGKYLQKQKQIGGDEFQALCPFHADTNPSFNFNNQNGKYFCHGCNKKGDAIHFYAKINSLDTRRDFNKILKGIAGDFGILWEEKKPKIVKTYDYKDAGGKLLFQVVRMDPKDFRQRRPGVNGDWIWNLKGVERVLYRLPDIKPAKEVQIVEGEKDADTLASLGYIATTCPMGAKSWKDGYNEALKGKDIVLIPDNDPEGREHMTQVAISLNGKANSLKWIDLPGLPSKGDVSDWVAKFDPKEEAAERLAVMIDRADFYEPPKKKSLEDCILSTSELIKMNIPEKQTLLHPWLKEDSIGLETGERGVGKSWWGLGVSDAVSKGTSFGPWECKKSVPCLFLDGEMPASDIVERINALNLHSDRKNPLYIYSDALANSYGLPRAHLANESWRTKMKSILITKKIKFWVIDNLASLASGIDENVKKDWDPINQWLLELRFAGITTLMLHHTNKEGGQRGTSAREDNIDISIVLKSARDYTPEDGARFIVHFTKQRIPTKDLSLIADTEFKLITDESGQYVWTWKNIRKENTRAVLELLNDGMDTKTICETLGITKGRVSQIRKKAVKDGYLTPKGSLTQTGYLFLNNE